MRCAGLPSQLALLQARATGKGRTACVDAIPRKAMEQRHRKKRRVRNMKSHQKNFGSYLRRAQRMEGTLAYSEDAMGCYGVF